MKAALYLLLLPFVLTAQTSIDGLWEGTMTVGGIYSNEALPMQLHITTTEDSIHGRSYITLPDGEILRMELAGRMYHDRSFSLFEVSFAGDEQNDVMPLFNRQYQIIYRPDLWSSELRGFWQEVTDLTFNERRRRGRMVLQKQKAKAA
jgi:hypothetical protein